MSLESKKIVFMIGVGGIGMSALARYFILKGKKVFGYDKSKSDLTKQLEKEGVKLCHDDDLEFLTENINTIDKDSILIIYTPAVSKQNNFLSFFIKNQFNVVKRSDVLAEITKDEFTIAVSGTHGKTTTATALTHILKYSGFNVTAFLGGISNNYKTNLIYNKNPDFIIVEADEYDRSFLKLNPDIAIITSVNPDHLDVYKTSENFQDAFKQFASQIKPNGFLIYEDSIKVNFSTLTNVSHLTYSCENKSDVYAANYRIIEGDVKYDMLVNLTHTEILEDKRRLENISLNMPGRHNLSNFLAASSVGLLLGSTFNDIYNASENFKGVSRRFDKHIDKEDLIYIDDYAHHPDEITATINTTKLLYPSKNLTVVFQPHLFSRTKDFAIEFADSLKAADCLVLLDIFPSRENPISGIDSSMLLNLCTNEKKEICSKNELIPLLTKKKLDVLLTLGAGDISNLVKPIKQILN